MHRNFWTPVFNPRKLYLHTHTLQQRGDVCTSAFLNVVSNRKAALCGLGEVVMASGLLLVASNQLLPLSTPRSFPTVTNVCASLLPFLKLLNFQSLFAITSLLFNPGDGHLPPNHGQLWAPTCSSLVRLPTPMWFAPFVPGGFIHVICQGWDGEPPPPPCSTPNHGLFGAEVDIQQWWNLLCKALLPPGKSKGVKLFPGECCFSDGQTCFSPGRQGKHRHSCSPCLWTTSFRSFACLHHNRGP